MLVVGGIALAALGAGAWWVRARSTSPVETLVVQIEEVAEEVRGPGVVDARIVAGVGSRVTGIVAEVFVDVGDRLEAGVPVARLKDSALRARLAAGLDTERGTRSRSCCGGSPASGTPRSSP